MVPHLETQGPVPSVMSLWCLFLLPHLQNLHGFPEASWAQILVLLLSRCVI
jgi:hypothetical protein